jgi:hypothetical protein
MTRYVLALALLTGATPIAAQQTAPLPELSLEQQTALRCSAAFAYVAAAQARDDPAMEGYPPVGARGKEFFVRSTAGLMDTTGATRPQVQELFRRSYADLAAALAKAPNRAVALGDVMRPCLVLLDAVIPPTPASR